MFAVMGVMVAFVLRSVKIQNEGKIGLVTSWGRFSRVLTPGRYILWPWESIVDELPLQIFEWETPPQKLMLRGGAPLTLSAVVYYQIEHAHKTPGAPKPPRIVGTAPAPLGSSGPAQRALPPGPALVASRAGGIGIDSLEPAGRPPLPRRPIPARPLPRVTPPGSELLNRILGRSSETLDVTHAAYRARYVVHDWQDATKKEALAVLQNVFSRISVAEDINGDLNWHETLGERVREHLTEKTERWGVQIVDVAFKDPQLSELTLQNLHAEARIEREGRVRTKEAESYRRVAEILNLSPPDLLRWRQVEIMRELSKSPQPRVMFTSDMMGRAMDAAPQQAPLLQAFNANGPAPAPAPDLRGYLGSEPPTPALPPDAHSAPTSTDVPRGMIAPSIQNIDQQ